MCALSPGLEIRFSLEAFLSEPARFRRRTLRLGPAVRGRVSVQVFAERQSADSFRMQNLAAQYMRFQLWATNSLRVEISHTLVACPCEISRVGLANVGGASAAV